MLTIATVVKYKSEHPIKIHRIWITWKPLKRSGLMGAFGRGFLRALLFTIKWISPCKPIEKKTL